MPHTPAATRHPLSLRAEAEAQATEIHSRRLAELAALAPLLAHLDALRPELTARKLTIYPVSVSLRRERLTGGYSGPHTKVLRLTTDAMFDHSRPSRWLAALRELGLRVLDFDKTGCSYGTVLLRKGPLVMRVDLAHPDRDALLASTASAATVLHCAAGQVAATAAAHPDKTVVCTTGLDGQPLPGGYAMAPVQQAQQVAA